VTATWKRNYGIGAVGGGRRTFQLVIKTCRAVTLAPTPSGPPSFPAVQRCPCSLIPSSSSSSSSSSPPPPSCKLINAFLTRSEASVKQEGWLVLHFARQETGDEALKSVPRVSRTRCRMHSESSTNPPPPPAPSLFVFFFLSPSREPDRPIIKFRFGRAARKIRDVRAIVDTRGTALGKCLAIFRRNYTYAERNPLPLSFPVYALARCGGGHKSSR